MKWTIRIELTPEGNEPITHDVGTCNGNRRVSERLVSRERCPIAPWTLDTHSPPSGSARTRVDALIWHQW